MSDHTIAADPELPDRWDQLDDWLTARVERVERDGLLPTAVWIFHDGRASGLLDTPPFALEDADRIIDAIVGLVPPMAPSGLLVMTPWMVEAHGMQIWGLRVVRWSREAGWRRQVWPVAIHGSPGGDPVDVELDDPWTRRLLRMFDGPSSGAPGLVHVSLPADMQLYATAGRALATATQVASFN